MKTVVIGIQLLVLATIYFFFFFFLEKCKRITKDDFITCFFFFFFSNLSVFMYLKINSQHLDAIVNLGYFLGEA